MLIFWEPRLVFLATPKAGSTAIEAALEPLAAVAVQRPAALKHVDIKAFRDHVQPWLESVGGGSFTTVALMREPVDWLRSWYRFKLRDDHEDPEHLMEGVSFAQFASNYASENGPKQMSMVGQAQFLTGGSSPADRIFRYEEMPRFVEFLEDQLDCAINLPRVNVPPIVDVDLDANQEAALRIAMAADIRLYQTL
ncbi:sulfotransferase family protein [Paracoccus sp. M683]|uniref:sulfotransferase family protein n=1 Tax=Paracoccus sp. M683 TaxID=2594268 RepID=UPI00117DCE27|nr:sulfotransferase family protein [Paracoccus sp. M683]TRW98285.1 sulfotransferase family protein [Paracoccus sp. M683]